MDDESIGRIAAVSRKTVTTSGALAFYLAVSFTAVAQTQDTTKLLKDLKSPSWYTRRTAAQELRHAADPRVESALVEALGDSDYRVRGLAAQSLGEMAALRALDALIQRLSDKEVFVVNESAIALGKLGDNRAFEPLKELLNTGNWRRRLSAIRALGELRDPRAIGLLIELLDDTADLLPETAAAALGKSRSPRAVAPLIRILKTHNGLLKARAVDALQQIGTPAVEPLVACLDHATARNPSMKILGKIAMASGDSQAIEAILSHSRPSEHSSDMQILGDLAIAIGDSRAIEALVLGLKDRDLAQVAASFLQAIGREDTTNALLASLRSGTIETACGAYRFFVGRGQTSTIPKLIEALKQCGHRSMAELFLNCGNPQLSKAAREWLASRGYLTIHLPGETAPILWGNKPG
jgi:HEAT repeat protein